MSDPYNPPTPPTEDGYYWALLVWDFYLGKYRTIIEVRHGQLLALTLAPLEYPMYRPVIPHDVIRWGPKVEFPEVKG